MVLVLLLLFVLSLFCRDEDDDDWNLDRPKFMYACITSSKLRLFGRMPLFSFLRYDDRASRRMDSASAEAATLGDVGDERDDTRSSLALKLSLSV